MSWLSPRFRIGRDQPIFNPLDCKKYFNYEENFKYGTIDIGINQTPIFYYIYFTLQEILDEIKK